MSIGVLIGRLYQIRRYIRLSWQASAVLALGLCVLVYVKWDTLKLRQDNEKLLQAVNQLPNTFSKSLQVGQQEYTATRLTRAYAELEQKLHLPRGTLERDLPGFAKQLLERTDTPTILRSKCFFVLKRYPEAEIEALKAHREVLASKHSHLDDAVEPLDLAGEYAREQIHYTKALEHFLAAAAFTSSERDILQWLVVQNDISYLYYLLGRYSEGLENARQAWQTAQQAETLEAPAVLAAHMYYASALDDCDQSASAETEYRAVIRLQERVLGKEHPDTLMSLSYLAEALRVQGKYVEAGQEHRLVLQLRERVLGADHPDTLTSRMNLAKVMRALGRPVEAEQEHRAVLQIKERVLGADHPATLKSRMGIASALYSQARYTDAEQEYRAILLLQMRVLPAEHPDVAMSCYDLALCLEAQQKLPEAFEFIRRAEQQWTKVLGPGHQDSRDAMADRERIEWALEEMPTK